MLGNGSKCILNCVLWFVSVIINFNVVCDAYRVKVQNFIELLKSNRIFWLMLGISFGNYFLTVYNESDDHLLLYFLYPPMYEITDC